MIKEVNDNNLINFLNSFAPDQAEFVTGNHFKHGENFSFGWFDNNKLVGCIRYCIQNIGQEQKTPVLKFKEKTLTEAKIIAFSVTKEYRNKSIGKKLQLKVIKHATEKGCSQIASYSTFDKLENYSVKIGLGFCIQPETQPDGTKGCFFLMKLNDTNHLLNKN